MKTSIISLFKRCTCFIVIIFLSVGINAYAASSDNEEQNMKYLQGIMNMIHDEYWGGQIDSSLIEGAVGGMLGSLDDYTTFYNNEEADAFFTSVAGVFGGIGVSMELSGDYIIVSKVFPASPAERAGILQGDKIVEADGTSLLKAAPEEAASIIRGEAGTKVRLGILRSGNSSVKYFEVNREIIRINPVTYEIRNGIGYIKLEEFNENTDVFLTEALNEIDKRKVTKIILDLRDNPGGEVGQAVAAARKFVPAGLITKLDFKSEKYGDVEYDSFLEKQKYKLEVLVNGMGASASEIVSGAIQDTGVGKLVGTKTFGKAKFQGLIPILTPEAFTKYEKELGIKAVNAFDLQMYYGIFPEDNEIAGYTKMTLGLYYTPKGRMIDGTGLKPDIAAADPEPVADIYINSIQKLTATTEPGLNSHGIDVYNAEKILKIMGYKIDTPDTTLDAKTVSAIKIYQKYSKLVISGILDTETQNAMNASLQVLIGKYDTQYKAAVNALK